MVRFVDQNARDEAEVAVSASISPSSDDSTSTSSALDEPRQKKLTPRGERTRNALVVAARVVFERDGFLDSRLTDITAEAKCAIGTFYTYFENKEQIFAAVLAAARDDMLHPGGARLDVDELDPYAVIEASNRAYYEAYERNGRLMMLQEQVATIDEEFRVARWNRGEAFVERNARSIARLQSEGLVDEDLDPLLAARLLSAMVGRMAYNCFAYGQTVPMDDLVHATTQIWANALGMKRPKRA